MNPPRSASTDRRNALGRAAGIFLLTLVIYLPIYRGTFIWNDYTLTENVVLQEDGLRRVWLTTAERNYWPLTWTAFWIEHRIWGLWPPGYHVVNVAVHAAASVLVGVILAALRIPGAWMAALLFAVHPVNAESAAWITQRKNTMSLLFFLLSARAYLRHDRHGGRGAYWGSVGLFWCAMLSKGAAVAMPLVVLLHAWWARRRIRRRDVVRALPFLVIAVGMGLVEIWFQNHRAIGEEAVRTDDFPSRLAVAGRAVWFYLEKALLPVHLCFVYPRWTIDPTRWTAWIPHAALLGVLGWAWMRRDGPGRAVLFGLGYFVLMLAPVLGFLDIYFMRYSFVADHYQYFAMIGVVALAVAGGERLLRSRGWLDRPATRILLAALVVALSVGTWRRAGVFRDDESLWRDTIRRNPAAWVAHDNLGALLAASGRRDEAIEHLRTVTRLRPDHAPAWNNLGVALSAQGRREEAAGCFERAVELDPDNVDGYNNLALTYRLLADSERSIRWYRKSLEVEPRQLPARMALGAVLLGADRPEEAVRELRAAVELAPGVADTHRQLGRALAAAGHPQEAARHLAEAARLAGGAAP